MPSKAVEKRFLTAIDEACGKAIPVNTQVLLIGNGINRVDLKGISWDSLVNALMDEAEKENMRPGEKPLTFLFEEISHNMDKGATRDNVKKLKKRVRELIERLEPGEMHRKFMSLKIKHVLTTNYDYCLERAIDDSFDRQKIQYVKTDQSSKKYSLRRHNEVKDKFIWHIHGELCNGISADTDTQYPEHSIMLGFDQYMNYAEEILQMIKSVNKEFFSAEDLTDKTWLTFLFTSNIHIVGLDLGVFESHLWWLLNFRAQLIRRYKNRSLHNQIKYYIPQWELNDKRDQVDMLTSLLVDIKAVPDVYDSNNKSYEQFYNEVFEILKDEFGAASGQ